MASTQALSSAKMAGYRATALQRMVQEQRALALRQARAWELARRAARLLKDQHGVQQVALFGSLARGHGFHSRSDVDLAVWGLNEKAFYRLVSQLQDLEPGIEVDLVMAEDMSPALIDAVEREGILL